jgi:hypothetical protein
MNIHLQLGTQGKFFLIVSIDIKIICVSMIIIYLLSNTVYISTFMHNQNIDNSPLLTERNALSYAYPRSSFAKFYDFYALELLNTLTNRPSGNYIGRRQQQEKQ